MAHQISNTASSDDSTIKMRASGELYVDYAGTIPITGTLSISPTGALLLADTANGKTYSITITNGVLQPVEV